ncbi:c-type cytochrome biogenesis protein CcmI [Gallaecimonas sp. GXIMD4217]|uniref:c-type cytochrome biogenesis protein CcmI n=1 Tax=Gallaecimonas sp. GXIMD4217 TaxID=3131927 RepID=UPI00311AFD58
MMELWLAMAVMVLLAAGFLLLPRARQGLGDDQQQVNLTLYRHRLRELEGERREGLVADDKFNQLENELKRSLLDDVDAAPRQQRALPWPVLLPGLALLLASLGIYAYLGGHQQQAHWQGVMDSLPTLAERALRPRQDEQLSRQDMQDLALGIRSRLAEQGDDKNAWVFLGRVAFSLGDAEMSADAFDKALELDPGNASALLGLAQSKLLSGSQGDRQRAAQALARLLSQDPGNVDALLLIGFVAFENQDFDKAIEAWSLLAKQLPAGDNRLALVQERLAEARRKASGVTVSLDVRVELAPELQDQLPEQASLFVFARDVAGGPPLAAVRMPLSRLPTQVVLSDETSMIPGRSLSQAQEVVVGARISAGESLALDQSGDLRGLSEPVRVDTGSVAITIKERIE